jgi:protein-tyrosine phosphatase
MLEGALNFRDVGGRLSGSGRKVRQHLVFRSNNLAHLTLADLDKVHLLAPQTVVDLRGTNELQMFPSRWPAALETKWINISIDPTLRSGTVDYKQILLDEPTPAGAMKAMDATYRILPDVCGPALKIIVDLVLAQKTPVVFHCSNGRDRTGVISMFLLDALGVSREEILADYLETNLRLDLEAAIKLASMVFTKEMNFEFDYATLRTLNQALPQNVGIAFDTINKTYGSPQRYLEAFDINLAQQEALRATMLERI